LQSSPPVYLDFVLFEFFRLKFRNINFKVKVLLGLAKIAFVNKNIKIKLDV
jgi:hypothetical protein